MRVAVPLALLLVFAAAISVLPRVVASHNTWVLPFDAGKSFYICQGYNGPISHQGGDYYGLDLTVNAPGPTACPASNASAALNVRAPTGGTVAWWSSTYGILCINSGDGLSVKVGHIDPSQTWTSGNAVARDQVIGTIAQAGTRNNNGVAHIHVGAYSDNGCSATIPFDSAHGTTLSGYDLPDTGGSNQYKGTLLTRMSPTPTPTPTPTPNPDSDGDGIPNTYEQAHACLDPNVSDGSGDPDRDEFRSLAEYLLGSNPCRDSMQLSYAANAGWIDAGIGLAAGEWFSSTATGVAYTSYGSAPVGPGGNAANPDFGWNNCTEAELVGYIGTSAPDPNTVPLSNIVCLGAGAAAVAPTAGRLYLAMNDPAAFSDNSGSWAVEITRGGSFNYQANEGWRDTGFDLTAGEWFSSSATGVAYTSYGSALVGPGGNAANPDFGWNNCTEAELVGYIGTAVPDPNNFGQPNVLCLGAGTAVVAPTAGRLYLAMNDPGAFSDNSGSWAVEITRGGSFNYQANEGWRDTGFDLTAGEWFSSTAIGVAYTSYGSAPVGPGGNAANPDFGWNNCTEAELVGYIGTSAPDPNTVPLSNIVCLGAGAAAVAPTAGRLYLAMNDPAAFSDNSGSWFIEITRQGMLKYRASGGWFDTQLAVSSTGGIVSVTALGNARFHAGSPLTGPDGSSPGPFGWGSCRENELVAVTAATPPDPNTMPLSGVVCIGAIGSFVASASGNLYLAMNDPGAFGDNSGRWSIRVSTPCPDSDSDGWTDCEEQFLGTDPLLACGPGAWPPDVAPDGGDGTVHIEDLTFTAARFGKRTGDDRYTPRAEIASQDGIIHIDDITAFAARFGQSC